MKLVLAVLLVATTARADDRAAAERLFRAGEKAYQAQNFLAAAQDFDHAFAALPLPEIAFSAGQAYRRQYRVEPKVDYALRAVELYRKYLDKVHIGGRVADAADALAEMQHEVDRLVKAGAKVSPEVAAESTQLGISVGLGDTGRGGGTHEIEDAVVRGGPQITVTIDGKRVEPYAPNNVVPGDHAIHVEAPGYAPIDKHEAVIQGTSTMREIELVPLPAHVAIDTEANARLAIDGRPAGSAPHAPLELAAGKHLIAITHRGREPIARELVVTNGQEVALHEPLAMTTRRRTVPWVIGSAAGLGVLTLSFALGALHFDHDASGDLAQIRQGNASASVLQSYDDARSHRDELTTGMWISGGAALVTAAIGGALYFFDNPSEVHVVPFGAGAGITARF